MPPVKETLADKIISFLEQGQNREQIEAHLLDAGHEEHFVKEIVREATKLFLTRRRAQGLTLVLCGAGICFVSFLLTIILPFSQSTFPYIMYGLTSVGIVVVFLGFMKVF